MEGEEGPGGGEEGQGWEARVPERSRGDEEQRRTQQQTQGQAGIERPGPARRPLGEEAPPGYRKGAADMVERVGYEAPERRPAERRIDREAAGSAAAALLLPAPQGPEVVVAGAQRTELQPGGCGSQPPCPESLTNASNCARVIS